MNFWDDKDSQNKPDTQPRIAIDDTPLEVRSYQTIPVPGQLSRHEVVAVLKGLLKKNVSYLFTVTRTKKKGETLKGWNRTDWFEVSGNLGKNAAGPSGPSGPSGPQA